MSSESAMHKRNLESSILFMQQEHAQILKSLHEEIARLQKRCTDLTFQLTMHGLTIDDSGSIDSQMQQVHQDLEGSRSRITQLEKDVQDKDKRIDRLETEAKAQRKRWLDESRTQSQAMNNLKAELEAKANNIAYLTTELHRLKSKQNISGNVVHVGGYHQGGGEEEADDGAGLKSGNKKQQPGASTQSPSYLNQGGDSSGKRATHAQHFTPAPPQRERSSFGMGSSNAAGRVRRSGGHSRSLAGSSVGGASMVMAQGKAIQGAHPASADAHLIRQHNNHPESAKSQPTIANPNSTLRLSSGRSSGSESPDISPFLPQVQEKEVALQGKQAPVLPPISGSGNNGKAFSPRTLQQQQRQHLTNIHMPAPPQPQVLVTKVVSSTSQHRQLKTSGAASTAPITTLAVENAAANKSDSAWALAQESRGSEYN